MGKKSKDKRKKLKYTKTEFQQIVCAKCRLCSSGTTPEFCYGEVYIANPKKFISIIFKNLLEIRTLASKISDVDPIFLSDEDIEYIFTTSFCSSNYCDQNKIENGVCSYLPGCLSVFRKQLKPQTEGKLIISSRRKMSKKERRQARVKQAQSSGNVVTRYVPHPYPTFFCNESMKEEVRRIVDGNCSEQQDTGKESS